MTKPKQSLAGTWLGAAALGLMLAACSSGSDEAKASGQALTESSGASTVSLVDSSVVEKSRSAPVQADGSFALDTSGLEAPYLLKVEWTDGAEARRYYAVSEGRENLDVNALTNLAFRSSRANDQHEGDDDDERNECEEDDRDYEDSDHDGKQDKADRVRGILAKLTVVLAPLFERYGIVDPRTDRDAVRLLLADVRLTLEGRTVTITNRATGGVIFVGQLSRLSEGVFTAANMPAGPGPGTGTCTAFTYSDFAACQPDNTQTRTVLTSTPAGCTGGAPVTTQACTYVPPVNACTEFTYSAFGDCQPGNTQVRTVLTSAPAGCTGGSPLLEQACTYVPPVNTCTAFTYGAFGSCQPDNTQTRAILTSSPAGCTGGAPVTTQACTYVPPVNTCTAFTYSAYGSCQPDNTQTRTVLTSSPAGCTGGAPVTTQACTYVPPVTTCTSFTYSAYGACQPNSTQTRTVLTSSPAGCTGGAPVTMQACTYTPPLDGGALYTQYCAGCHGNGKKGSSASSIQTAIDNNVGGMGSAALRALTPAQVAAIAAAP